MSTTQPSDGSDPPRPIDETTRRRFQRQPRQDTRPELELRRELHRRGLRYRIERKILPDTRRRAGIVCPTQRVAVFVDGCFWHSCPDHRTVPRNNRQWWESKLRANVERDRDTDRRLVDAGWLVIRVWEHETPLQLPIASNPPCGPERRSSCASRLSVIAAVAYLDGIHSYLVSFADRRFGWPRSAEAVQGSLDRGGGGGRTRLPACGRRRRARSLGCRRSRRRPCRLSARRRPSMRRRCV